VKVRYNVNKKYRFISDPGHGWLEVPGHEIAKLGIADKISEYSYVHGKMVYLEEDCDAKIFIDAKGLTVADIVYVYEESTAIRSYSHYE
jgi:hypothetical protein